MVEESNVVTQEQPVEIDDEAAKRLGEESFKRINQTARMVKEYYRAIHGTINSVEMYMLGFDTLLAGWQLIERSATMDELDVDTRLQSNQATLNVLMNVLNKTHLNPEVVANQVAQASIEAAERAGKLKGIK